MPRSAFNLKGHRYGALTVLKRNGSNKHGHARWLCECDCGQRKIVDGHALRGGRTRSCGCWQRTEAARRARRRGMEFVENINLEEIEQRLRNTTPGTWNYIEEDGVVRTSQPSMAEICVIGDDGSEGDMHFIAKARADIQDLIKAMRARDFKIDCLQAYINGFHAGSEAKWSASDSSSAPSVPKNPVSSTSSKTENG